MRGRRGLGAGVIGITNFVRYGIADYRAPSREERFWRKVNQTNTCWLWTAGLTSGYGNFFNGNKMIGAHRYSWELSGGVLPAGMQLDHICHIRACVNPAHLRLVNHALNAQNRSGTYAASGVRGVYPYKGRFRARFTLNGKVVHLGYFNTIKEAEKVVVKARRECMTHSEMDKPYRIAASVTQTDPKGSFLLPKENQ